MSTGEPVEVSHPYVERVEGVHGGRPIIKGTRFPVSSLIQNHRRGLSVDEILIAFSHLTPAQVYDALSFYYDHRTQIDQEISELTDPHRKAHQYPPTLTPSDATS
ncbi:MAG: hypothetical protein NPIRA05_21830 [Nitrospirales bacterium]|nr:MAG: hypothetical protein NPIRA05_21830 [Nitrospirales bacterium]